MKLLQALNSFVRAGEQGRAQGPEGIAMDQKQEQRLARKGAKQNVANLLAQAGCSLNEAVSNRERLREYGFSAERESTLRALRDKVEEQLGARSVDSAGSDYAVRSERRAQDAAKAFIKKLRLAAPMAVQGYEHPEGWLEQLRSGRKLKRSSARICDFLAKARPTLEALEEGFRPYFAGQSVVALLSKLAAELADCAGDKNSRRASKPLATLSINLAKGQLLEGIEDLNRIAQLAFSDEPHIAALFDLRILRRGKRKRGVAQDAPTEVPAAEPAPLVQAAAAAAPPAPKTKAEPVVPPAASATAPGDSASTRPQSEQTAPYFAVAAVRAYEDGEPTGTPPGRPPSG